MLDSTFSLFSIAMQKSRANARGFISIVQDGWGCPPRRLVKADGDKPRAGDHGIPEIGRQEDAFYAGLTDGQKEAYRAVQTTVDLLFDASKEGKTFEGIDPWQIDEPIDAWKHKAFHNLATHPMQAYLVGQMLAADHLKGPMMRPLLPTDSRAIGYLQNYTFNEIDNSFNRLKSKLRHALINGMEQGDNPKEVGRKLMNELKDYEHQWDVIAITETARAESQGRLREIDDASVAHCIGSSAHDLKTCDWCKANIDGKVYAVSDVLQNTNYGKKQADWVACIPAHPRCFVTGTVVSAGASPAILAGASREYIGEVVTLALAMR